MFRMNDRQYRRFNFIEEHAGQALQSSDMALYWRWREMGNRMMMRWRKMA